jgi:uncharacterized protein (TIGR02118 family)
MYKLVILVEPQDHTSDFDAHWSEFLAAAERMPGLRREVTSRVDKVLYGKFGPHLIHELHFDSLKAAGDAMGSPEGKRTGEVLQRITGGKVSLLFADHLQDELSHIQRHAPTEAPPADRA